MTTQTLLGSAAALSSARGRLGPCGLPLDAPGLSLCGGRGLALLPHARRSLSSARRRPSPEVLPRQPSGWPEVGATHPRIPGGGGGP